MAELNPYLTFNGNCKEAMAFYEKCIGGELTTMPFESMPGQDLPPEAKGKIMHATLKNGNFVLMASDAMPGKPGRAGDNITLSLNCHSDDEIEKAFRALGEGGKVTMALHDAFWGARFGMLTDKFGIPWMFNYDKK